MRAHRLRQRAHTAVVRALVELAGGVVAHGRLHAAGQCCGRLETGGARGAGVFSPSALGPTRRSRMGSPLIRGGTRGRVWPRGGTAPCPRFSLLWRVSHVSRFSPFALVIKRRVCIFGWPGVAGSASALLCVDGQLDLTVGTKRQRTGAVQTLRCGAKRRCLLVGRAKRPSVGGATEAGSRLLSLVAGWPRQCVGRMTGAWSWKLGD